MQFSDHVGRKMPSSATVQKLLTSDETSSAEGITPTGSIKSWMTYNSYGKFKFEAEVIPTWITTDNTEKHYAYGKSGLTVDTSQSFFPVLDKLDNDGFDFSRFDADNDGKIDVVLVMHSGYAADIGGLDCSNKRPDVDRIWSHAMASPGKTKWQSKKNPNLTSGLYSFAAVFRGTCHERPARISVIIHEFMHLLGVPDLNDLGGYDLGHGIGDYDVMGNAHGVHGGQIYPTHLSPWSKVRLGWVQPQLINYDGAYTLEPSWKHPQVFAITKNFPKSEYLLIEYRQAVLWDSELPGEGILIYHIDDVGGTMKTRGYPGMQKSAEGKDWPSNGKHYRVSVVQADGKYDIEHGRNSADKGDYFVSSDQQLVPGLVEDAATSKGTYPNTNSYQNGEIKQTGIRIFNFRKLDGGNKMSFEVTGLGPAPAANTDPSSAQSDIVLTLNPTTLSPSSIYDGMISMMMSPTKTDVAMTVAAATDPPTKPPTRRPTRFPTTMPTSLRPTPGFTLPPTFPPTIPPTAVPTPGLTSPPTQQPTPGPTLPPTAIPTPGSTSPTTLQPTFTPTPGPTLPPTHFPTPLPTPPPTFSPTPSPTHPPSPGPTPGPTLAPTTVSPSPAPTSGAPVVIPTTLAPTTPPTLLPTGVPTLIPTANPTPAPTLSPTFQPTSVPTPGPTPIPTAGPTNAPTLGPEPTLAPTRTPVSLAPTTLVPTTTVPQPSSNPTLAVTSPTESMITSLGLPCNDVLVDEKLIYIDSISKRASCLELGNNTDWITSACISSKPAWYYCPKTCGRC